VNDLRAGPDLSLNEHADKRRVNAVAQVRAVIDWSQVSVQGVRVHTQPPHLPASHAVSGFSSLGDSAGSSSSRSPTLGSTRRLLGGSRDTASTASVPLTMLTEVRTDAALEPSTPDPLPGGAAQDDIQEGEKDDIQNAPRAGQVPSRRRHGAGQCAFMCAGTIIKLCG
jgi:hypothetical protein